MIAFRRVVSSGLALAAGSACVAQAQHLNIDKQDSNFIVHNLK
jgi:hypothetical protein